MKHVVSFCLENALFLCPRRALRMSGRVRSNLVWVGGQVLGRSHSMREEASSPQNLSSEVPVITVTAAVVEKYLTSCPSRGQHLECAHFLSTLFQLCAGLQDKLASGRGDVVPFPNKAPVPSLGFQLSLFPPAPETAKCDLPRPTKEPKGGTPFLSQHPGRAM